MVYVSHAPGLFRGEHLGHGILNFPRSAFFLRPHPDGRTRSAEGHLFGGENLQAMLVKKWNHRREAEVAEVLVIDGVEQRLINEIEEIGGFNDEDAIVIQQRGQRVGEGGDVIHVRKYIGGGDDLGPAVGFGDMFRGFRAEKFSHHLEARGFGPVRDF